MSERDPLILSKGLQARVEGRTDVSDLAIASRRAALEAEAAALHRARGAASLEGTPFDGARLAAIGTELASLDDAEAVERQRAEDEATTRASEARRSIQAAIAEKDDLRLEALATAEQAAATLVEALARVLDLTHEIARAATALRISVPVMLERTDVETRLSNLIVGALAPIRTSAQRFGVLEWFAEQPPTKDWAAAERRAAARAIAQLCQQQETAR